MTSLEPQLIPNLFQPDPHNLMTNVAMEEIPKNFMRGLCNLWETLLSTLDWKSDPELMQALKAAPRGLRQWVPHAEPRMRELLQRTMQVIKEVVDEEEEDGEADPTANIWQELEDALRQLLSANKF